jgi:hypothetical protein
VSLLGQAGLWAATLAVLLGGAADAFAAKKKTPSHRRGHAPSRKHSTRPPEFTPDADRTAASRYAALGPNDCRTELERRGIRFTQPASAPGVLIPVRLTGPVAGVVYRTDFPDRQRSKVPYEVFDCRLVLALFDFGSILRDHDVVEVRMYSAWRPPPRSWPEGKISDRHPGGLAADLRLFRKSSGEELAVEESFRGEIGAAPCPSSGTPASPAGPASDPKEQELRDVLCRAAAARIFHVLLSPNFDHAHRNHFHVEIRRGVRWFIVR